MARIENGGPGVPQRVERTGIALVHEGERIYPAPEAIASLTPDGERAVHYHFPIEIEVLGLGAADALAARVYEALQREMSTLG